MFLRDLSEKIIEQTKVSVNDALGQTETWTTVRTFWGSVVEVSSDTIPDAVKFLGEERTARLYAILARSYTKSWTFMSSRFVWNSTDFDNPRILLPVKNLLKPGRQYREWAKIGCIDITDYTDIPQ